MLGFALDKEAEERDSLLIKVKLDERQAKENFVNEEDWIDGVYLRPLQVAYSAESLHSLNTLISDQVKKPDRYCVDKEADKVIAGASHESKFARALDHDIEPVRIKDVVDVDDIDGYAGLIKESKYAIDSKLHQILEKMQTSAELLKEKKIEKD